MEYKTYKCDIKNCGASGAQRFTFPCVDRRPRQIAEESLRELEIPGTVDLCDRHVGRILEAYLSTGPSMQEQAYMWKTILGKGKVD